MGLLQIVQYLNWEGMGNLPYGPNNILHRDSINIYLFKDGRLPRTLLIQSGDLNTNMSSKSNIYISLPFSSVPFQYIHMLPLHYIKLSVTRDIT